MRHRITGRQLGRGKDERKTLFRNLASQLILHGRIKTTIAKAKAIQGFVEKLVTKAKKTTLAHNREVYEALPKESALLLISHIAPRFTNRTSGFSRIVRLGERSGDNAHMVILEWVEQMDVDKGITSIKSTTSTTGDKKTKKARDTRGTRGTHSVSKRVKRSQKEKIR